MENDPWVGEEPPGPAAHTPNDACKPRWHPLDEHLKAVAELARGFAGAFGAGELAAWLGLWHDLGKFNPAFQDYLVAEHQGRPHPKVPHARWGAVLAYALLRGQKAR